MKAMMSSAVRSPSGPGAAFAPAMSAKHAIVNLLNGLDYPPSQ